MPVTWGKNREELRNQSRMGSAECSRFPTKPMIFRLCFSGPPCSIPENSRTPRARFAGNEALVGESP
jgi:hypothetical protein